MRTHRAFLIAAILPLALALGGCETSGFWDSANNVTDRFQDMMADFSPFGTGKKPLPGERRAVFPEGVPGVQQGVPPELMRGNPQAVEQAVPPPAPTEQTAANGKKKKTASKGRAPSQAPGAQSASQPADDEVWPPPPSR